MLEIVPSTTEVAVNESPLAQNGASQASDIVAWEQFKSVVERYFERDLITEELVSRITKQVRESSETVVSTISISLIYIIIAISGGLWLAGSFFGYSAPPFANNSATVEWLLYHLLDFLSVFGLSEALTGNKYILSLIASAIVALLSETQISRELRRKTREYVEVVDRTRAVVKNRKQIFVGGGQIRFSYGTLGVWVRGGNLDLRIRWGAIEGWALYVRTDAGWVLTTKLDDADYFVIFLKPRTDRDPESVPAEFLVVPERFFHKPVDANSWDEFVGSFPSFLTTPIGGSP